MVLFKLPVLLIIMNYALSTNYVTFDIENLGDLQDGANVMSNGCSHVVGRTSLAPLVDELTAGQRELGAHVGIAKGKDFAFLVDTLSNHELEDTVLVLRDSQIGHRTRRRIELRQIATTRLSMKYGNDFHGWLLGLRDVEVARAGVTDDTDILGEVNAVHLCQCAGT